MVIKKFQYFGFGHLLPLIYIWLSYGAIRQRESVGVKLLDGQYLFYSLCSTVAKFTKPEIFSSMSMATIFFNPSKILVKF